MSRPSNLTLIKSYMAKRTFGAFVVPPHLTSLTTAVDFSGAISVFLAVVGARLRRFAFDLLLLLALIFPSLSHAADTTAWFYVCTNFSNGFCNGGTYQQITVPDSAVVAAYAAQQNDLTGLVTEKPILDWYVTNQAGFQAILSNPPAPAEPFDYVVAGQFFAFAFVTLMVLYFASHGIGLFLKSVRGRF